MASQHQNPIRESGIEVELQNRRRSDTKGKKEEINQGQEFTSRQISDFSFVGEDGRSINEEMGNFAKLEFKAKECTTCCDEQGRIASIRT